MGVVSYFAHSPFEPRGLRTRAIVDALTGSWSIELVAGPEPGPNEPDVSLRERIRRHAAYRLGQSVALDSVEGWSRWHLGRWSPALDAAVLIGYPYSPVAVAAGRLEALEVPYVVDSSDPWALTTTDAGGGRLSARRARAAEGRLWRGAAGAIVTTEAQAEALRRLFPDLPTLVRPNGYTPVPCVDPPARREDGSTLRIAHFGNLYSPRVDVAPFFRGLVASGRWSRIELEQFGGDWNQTLQRLPEEVAVSVHPRLPWAQVVVESTRCDLALVVGNVGALQLPSKVIEYLTLPIPRLALLDDPARDPITDYVAAKPGWLLLAASETRAADRVFAHVGRGWAADELRAPPGESWPVVGAELAAFVEEQVGAPKRADDRPARAGTPA